MMKRAEFLALVNDAMAMIPDRFRDAMKNIAIVVEDEPSARALADVGLEPPDTLLGLYEGTPLTERQWAHGNVLPDKITLFQLPIEDASSDSEDVMIAIAETLIHEVGHYFGLSEEEIEEIEERYWNGEGLDDEDDDDTTGDDKL
jgi:predicted Zn-dependent protease with MMP-like domain